MATNKLSEQDAALYYELMIPLLDYVNQKHQMYPELYGNRDSTRLGNRRAMELNDKLWEDTSVIDEYLATLPADTPERHINLLKSWKHPIRNTFYLLRLLQSGCVFLSDDDAYLVKGLLSSFDEMFFFSTFPVLAQATLIPFEDVIITDGILKPYNMTFGPGIKKSLNASYKQIKEDGQLHRTFPIFHDDEDDE